MLQIILNEYKIELKDSVRLKVYKFRRIKVEYMDAVRVEIDKLLKMGCIISVDNSEWEVS